MQRYVFRRVFALAATLVFVSLLVFAVVRVLPGDPALIILGLEANADSVARVRQELGLDRPMPVQYAQWVGRALRGDLGRSIQYDLPVSTLILTRLTVTLPLTLLAAGLMIAAAIPLGVFAATRHRRWGDYLTMTLSQIGVAVPGFWAGLLLILFFSVHLGWVRAGGFDGWGQGFWPALRSLLMPAAALGLFQFAVLARTTRSAVLEVLREEYVKTARAKGVAERRVTVPPRAAERADPGGHGGGRPARLDRGRQHRAGGRVLPAGRRPPAAGRHQRRATAGGAGGRAVRGLDDHGG